MEDACELLETLRALTAHVKPRMIELPKLAEHLRWSNEKIRTAGYSLAQQDLVIIGAFGYELTAAGVRTG